MRGGPRRDVADPVPASADGRFSLVGPVRGGTRDRVILRLVAPNP